MKGFCKKHTTEQILLNNQCRKCVHDNITEKNRGKPSIDRKHKTIIAKWRRRLGN